MAIHILNREAEEEGTFPVKLEFRDENDALVSPNAAAWTLTDPKGRVINDRVSVTIAAPTNTEYIVLSGDDLALPNAQNRIRYITVEWDYNSTTYGNNLPKKDEVHLKIREYKKVT
jgi:hypothetical protein